MSIFRRQPKGTATGGQFAATHRAEASRGIGARLMGTTHEPETDPVTDPMARFHRRNERVQALARMSSQGVTRMDATALIPGDVVAGYPADWTVTGYPRRVADGEVRVPVRGGRREESLICADGQATVLALGGESSHHGPTCPRCGGPGRFNSYEGDGGLTCNDPGCVSRAAAGDA